MILWHLCVYEKAEYVVKVSLTFYKRIRVELIVSFITAIMFFIIPDFLAKRKDRKIQQ